MIFLNMKVEFYLIFVDVNFLKGFDYKLNNGCSY